MKYGIRQDLRIASSPVTFKTWIEEKDRLIDAYYTSVEAIPEFSVCDYADVIKKVSSKLPPLDVCVGVGVYATALLNCIDSRMAKHRAYFSDNFMYTFTKRPISPNSFYRIFREHRDINEIRVMILHYTFDDNPILFAALQHILMAYESALKILKVENTPTVTFYIVSPIANPLYLTDEIFRPSESEDKIFDDQIISIKHRLYDSFFIPIYLSDNFELNGIEHASIRLRAYIQSQPLFCDDHIAFFSFPFTASTITKFPYIEHLPQTRLDMKHGGNSLYYTSAENGRITQSVWRRYYDSFIKSGHGLLGFNPNEIKEFGKRAFDEIIKNLDVEDFITLYGEIKSVYLDILRKLGVSPADLLYEEYVILLIGEGLRWALRARSEGVSRDNIISLLLHLAYSGKELLELNSPNDSIQTIAELTNYLNNTLSIPDYDFPIQLHLDPPDYWDDIDNTEKELVLNEKFSNLKMLFRSVNSPLIIYEREYADFISDSLVIDLIPKIERKKYVYIIPDSLPDVILGTLIFKKLRECEINAVLHLENDFGEIDPNSAVVYVNTGAIFNSEIVYGLRYIKTLAVDPNTISFYSVEFTKNVGVVLFKEKESVDMNYESLYVLNGGGLPKFEKWKWEDFSKFMRIGY